MKLCTLAVAVSLALAGGCNRNRTTPPSPKPDSSSIVPQAAAGSSATSTPVQGQVDPKHADQRRDFRQSGDDAGLKSSDTQPTMKN